MPSKRLIRMEENVYCRQDWMGFPKLYLSRLGRPRSHARFPRKRIKLRELRGMEGLRTKLMTVMVVHVKSPFNQLTLSNKQLTFGATSEARKRNNILCC